MLAKKRRRTGRESHRIRSPSTILRSDPDSKICTESTRRSGDVPHESSTLDSEGHETPCSASITARPRLIEEASTHTDKSASYTRIKDAKVKTNNHQPSARVSGKTKHEENGSVPRQVHRSIPSQLALQRQSKEKKDLAESGLVSKRPGPPIKARPIFLEENSISD